MSGPSTVVVVVSRDHGLVQDLPHALAQDNAAIEVQVVSNLAGLDYLAPLEPDAMILDVEDIALPEVTDFFRMGYGDRVPTIVVDPPASDEPQLWLAAGAAGVVRKEGEWLRQVGEEVKRTRRLMALSNRAEEQEQHYLRILEASEDGIFTLTDGVFTYTNESFAKRVGCSSESLEGRTLVELLAPEHARTIRELLARVEVTDGPAELVEVALEGSGRVFEVSFRSSVLDGQRVVVGVARDVTEVRAIQDELERARQRATQAERLRSLGELAAGVAHDFNNSLGTILGRLELAQEKLARGEGVGEDLSVLEKAAHNAAAIVRRIEEFSRPQEESWDEVDLQQATEDAAAFVRTRIPADVSFWVSASPTPVIRGNGQELCEVLLNLLTNAIDAVSPGGAIRLSCGEEDGQAVVTVEDDGAGMPPEVQKRIFEPFFTTKESRGTGLGLAVSHWILRRHDARLHLRSDPGEGTRFKLVFTPFAPAPRQEAHLAQEHFDILVVDDDTTVGELMSDLLSEQGHRVQVVESAEAARAALQHTAFHVMITDLDLPDMSGWQLAREVRVQRPDLAVGLTSGWPLRSSMEELRQRGVDFWLSKPFSLDQIQTALENIRGGD